MRHEKAEVLIRLALALQGTLRGLSIPELQEKIGELQGAGPVSRRTAERMRDAVDAAVGLVEVPGNERVKRWRIPTTGLSRLLRVTAEDLAALEQARRVLKRERLPDAKVIQDLARKLQSHLKSEELRLVEPDLEEMIAAEGLALRPGPRPQVNPVNLTALRRAIIERRQVRFLYRNKAGRRSRQTVYPYGFIYGSRQFLIAWHPDFDDIWMYRLAAMDEVETLDATFERREDFNLGEYAQRAFVTYQGEPVDVVWRFDAEAAADALEFEFHPTQQVEKQKDGAVVVRFRAALSDEMCWHLFTWGDRVEIVEPQELKDNYRDWVRWAAKVAG